MTQRQLKDFLGAGHLGTLLGAFVYFTVSTVVWVMIGALGVDIAKDFQLTATEKGLFIALPILTGSLLRVPVGIASDRIGPKKTGALGLVFTLIPLLLGWLGGNSLSSLILIGLTLGFAGASFAVALPLVSRWYSARYQGLVMGIVGSGNCGTVIAALTAPRLANFVGWHGVFGLAILPVVVTLALFFVFAKEQPQQPAHRRPANYLKALRENDTWWFSLFYMVTFGGFVGLASFLTVFFYDQYGVGKVMAGNLTALCVFGGSFLRPVGGLLADRRGGIKILMAVVGIIAGAMFLISQLPPLTWAIAELFVGVCALGIGNGAVFQLVPQRFGKEIGAVTGLVGAVGGVGGFLLPFVLGVSKDLTGSYGAGFVFLTAAACACMTLLAYVQREWRRDWAREEVGVSF